MKFLIKLKFILLLIFSKGSWNKLGHVTENMRLRDGYGNNRKEAKLRKRKANSRLKSGNLGWDDILTQDVWTIIGTPVESKKDLEEELLDLATTAMTMYVMVKRDKIKTEKQIKEELENENSEQEVPQEGTSL
tara:strand:+ start:1347 stop:1745 length:399 start_codon:yes stop_codon:yes gene_type:complete